LEAQAAIRQMWETERSVFPSLPGYAERLEQELWKSYQRTQHGNIAYLVRLQDENKLLFVLDRMLSFLQSFEQSESSARVAVIKLTYLYYKNDTMYETIKTRMNAKGEVDTNVYLLENSETVIADLVSQVQANGAPRARVRATLYHVYHHALHNRVRPAKDIMMKSHMSQLSSHMNVDNQIMYNRALTQTGLAAFRLGRINEAHDLLVDICNNAKNKELLAQGYSRNQEKSTQYELEENKRQIPFHMQINLAVLDCSYLICAMLLEIPNYAQH